MTADRSSQIYVTRTFSADAAAIVRSAYYRLCTWSRIRPALL